MRANSLWFRLIASSTAIALVLLVTSAFLLNAIFVQALERNFDQRLRAALDGILANIELGQDGRPQLQAPVADTRFSLPLSGWYWQVNEAGSTSKILSSPSLLEQQLQPPEGALATRASDGVAAFSMRDTEGIHLRVIQQDLKLFGTKRQYGFLVAGNFDELKAEITSFQRLLFLLLAALGCGLMAALIWQVRYALRPLNDMQHQLNAIRGGKREYLDKDFPNEVQPLADELNKVVESNLEIVDRSRLQVGNLAHALKTPLSVLNNEARGNKTALAAKVREQVAIMGDQVSLYLERARRIARAQVIGSATEVEPVVQALVRTLQRINRERGLEIKVDVAGGLKFRGERQDLEEMVGNAMDNACKWAKHEVLVTGRPAAAGGDGRTWLNLMVDDDGPGIPPEKREEAMRRGRRLDETKPGSGLGMSIISETAGMYSGSITLGKADLGGLRANLRLPSVV